MPPLSLFISPVNKLSLAFQTLVLLDYSVSNFCVMIAGDQIYSLILTLKFAVVKTASMFGDGFTIVIKIIVSRGFNLFLGNFFSCVFISPV